MKKTLNVNLNGRVFTIDEDAYRLLDDYLSNLRHYFRKEDGASEIITDFESRIEELFREKIRLGHQVITIEHVEEVIARVGKPSDFVDGEEMAGEKEKVFSEPEKGKKKFFRNLDNKLLGGVCSGLAVYMGWNVVTIRFILIIVPLILSSLNHFPLNHFPSHHFMPWVEFPSFIFNNLGALFIIAYLIAWLIVPSAKTVEQKLQMMGHLLVI